MSISVGPILKHKYNPPQHMGWVRWSRNGSQTNKLTMSEADWAKLKPDESKIVYEYEVALFDHLAHIQDSTQTLATNKVKLEAPFEVLPPGSSTVKLIKDPAYQQAVEDAVKIGRVKSLKMGSNPDEHYINIYLSVEQRVFPVPGSPQSMKTIDFAFDVVLRHADKDYMLSWGTSPGDSNVSGIHTSGSIAPNLVGETVDIILRPSVLRAENSVDCDEIWGEEIVFEGVVVQ